MDKPLLPSIPSLDGVTDAPTRKVLEALKEIIEIGIGTRPRSDAVDSFVTFRDLYNAGMVSINLNGNSVTNPDPDNSIITPISEVDFSTPPTPTGFTATGLSNAVFLQWDNPTYNNYAYTEVYRASVDDIGQAALIGSTVGFIYTDNITLTNATLFYWIRFVSKNDVKGQFNAINGTSATTSVDVNAILDLLDGQLSESALVQSLRERINLIDDSGTVTQTVTQRIAAEASARAQALINEANARGTAIANEATLRQSADNSLAQSISLISAGVSSGFDAGKMYNFDSDLEGWTAVAGTATAVFNGGWIDVTAITADPMFRSPNSLNIQGSKYATIKARIKRLAGSGWDGRAYYTTAGHSESNSYYKSIPAPSPFNVGDTAIVEWDMASLTVGGNDWVANTINQIRLDFGNSASDVISVDWVAIGRNSPGASVAALEEEKQARITGDNAEATARSTLASQVNNPTTGLAAAHSAITAEQTARASADTALSTQITTVSSRISSRPNVCPDVDKWTFVWFNGVQGSGTTSIVNDTWGKWLKINTPPNASYHVANSPIMPVQPNAAYVITGDSMFFVGAGGSARCYFDIVMWDASNNLVLDGGQGIVTTQHDFSTSDSTRTLHAVQVTAPANAAIMQARFIIDTLVNVTVAGFRQVKVERGTLPASPYTQEKDSADAIAAIQTEVTARATADSAIASSVTTVSASLTGGGNQLRHSSWANKLTLGAVLGANGTGQTAAITYTTDPNYTFGETLQLWFASTPPAGTTANVVMANRFDNNYAVIAGKRYEFSIFLDTHRCQSKTIIVWVNQAGADIGSIEGNTVNRTARTCNTLEEYTRSFVFGVAPAGAAYARLIIQTAYNNEPAPYVFFCRPYFGEATASQTQPSPWAESARGLNEVYAKYSVKVDANGYVSGFGLISSENNDAPFSEFAIVADKFSIAPVATSPTAADGSPFYYLTSPTIVNGVTVPAGAYMKRAYIADATIVTAQITDLAVNNAKIANLAVNDAKIASVSASKILTGTLQASQSVTVGSGGNAIIIDGNGNIRAGATGFATGTGMWQGLDSGAYKMFVGSQTGENFTWDGANFSIKGTLRNGQSAFGVGNGFFSGKNASGVQQVSMGDGINKFVHWTGNDLLIKSNNINLSENGLIIDGSGTFSGALNAATGSFAGNLMAGVLDFSKLAGELYTYLSAGTYTITVPPEKTTMRVSICGGSGGGGFTGWENNVYNFGGGGGGGSNMVVATFNNLTPGATYTLVVGAKGIGATTVASGKLGNSGSNGGDSYITGLITAQGGQGGTGGNGGSSGGIGGAGRNGAGSGQNGGGMISTVVQIGPFTDTVYSASPRALGGKSTNGGTNGGDGGQGAIDINPPENPSMIYGQNGQDGKAYIEFFNPNSVVLKTEYNTLVAALQRQGIQTV